MNATDSSDNSSFVKLLFFSNVILTNEELWCMNVLMLTTGTIVLCCLIKLLYFKFIRFTHFIPESLISIALGALFGLLKLTTYVELTHYNANTFFIIFLPPIILEAVLQMHRVSLMRNISLIFVFGFFGTVLNFLLLGTSLWLLSSAQFVWTDEQAFRPHAYFLFSALMSCVDPVLVVSILGEMHVNPSLYFIFVGESVINDGVCLIIFHYVHLIGCGHIPWDGGNHGMTALIGIVVVCVKIITGCLIGSIMGCLVCFLTRYTASYAVIEPMLIMSGCYLTYLIDFSASWPGILSILIYGLIQTSYTFENISPKSRITVKRFTHVTASISESLVLMLLGYTSVVERGHGWSANFIVTSLIMTTIWRFLIVYTLATVANHLRLLKDPITETMKFVIGFCGLRGSISHCLVEVIDSACLQANQLSRSSLFSTVFVLTLFTITVIGTLMRPLLKLFRMKFQSQPISLFHALNEELILKLNFLAEEITGATEGGHFSRRLKQFGQK